MLIYCGLATDQESTANPRQVAVLAPLAALQVDRLAQGSLQAATPQQSHVPEYLSFDPKRIDPQHRFYEPRGGVSKRENRG